MDQEVDTKKENSVTSQGARQHQTKRSSKKKTENSGKEINDQRNETIYPRIEGHEPPGSKGTVSNTMNERWFTWRHNEIRTPGTKRRS